jgi:integral membrane protein (TIGR01906 family)
VNARRWRGYAEAAVTALLWTALVVGSSAMTLTVPVYTSGLTQTIDVPASSGLSAADVIRLSGEVRALVADADFSPLPATWKGQPAFDAAAVSHLMDVRSVLSAARLATGIAAFVLAVYVGFCVARRRFDRLGRGMRAGAWLIVVLVVLAALAAVTSFDTFFAAFHSLFFAAGTWTFPADSLLIRLFPEAFWEASGAAWAALAVAGAAVLGVAARMLRSATGRLGASRTANNV